jgi:hypothetical protein
MEREIGRWMRLQFIHLLGESQWPPFRAFKSASIDVYLRLFFLSQLPFSGLRNVTLGVIE